MAAPAPGSVIPAQLGFLAIYNPSLGRDETIEDQIVYYASVKTQHQRRKHRSRGRPTDHLSQEERYERLRQIGLAQGMVEFSRGFSGGAPVDTIETERARVVLHELEPGWWILASVDLSKVPLPPKLATSKTPEPADENVEYTSKEIKPPGLLLQDLLRAHAIFLLHHDTSLSSLFVRTRRSKFVSLLGRYWDLFLSTWNVMLHGNPTRGILGGINIAASGELGMGVGEEDRGSGEREVLEGLVGRIEGLVDLVVSKFGDDEEEKDSKKLPVGVEPLPWLGTGQEPDAEDGAIFLGVGALSRKSLRDVTRWMEDLYTWGENAYGVIESPTSTRGMRKTAKASDGAKSRGKPISEEVPGPPAPVSAPAPAPVASTGTAAAPETSGPKPAGDGEMPPAEGAASSDTPVAAGTTPTAAPDSSKATTDITDQPTEGPMDKVVSYLKFGYGTYWTLGKLGELVPGESSQPPGDPTAAPKAGDPDTKKRPKIRKDSSTDATFGHYLIGLKGVVEEVDPDAEYSNSDDAETEHNSRTSLRTVHVELETEAHSRPEAEVVKDLSSPAKELAALNLGEAPKKLEYQSQDRNKAKKLRVVVYVNQPFIFTFLFQLRTDSLAWDALYRSLHYQLAPLRKSLATSTAYRPERPGVGATLAANLFDLVWDPRMLTVHSTLPNIPDPGPHRSGTAPLWSRAEATNTHMQLLHMYGATRADIAELERTCKTNRGWWLVWTRIVERPAPVRRDAIDEDDEDDETVAGGGSSSGLSTVRPSAHGTDEGDDTIVEGGAVPEAPEKPVVSKEIFLIRRASDHAGFRGVSASYTYTESGSSWADGPGRLAQGIGVDTKKYIEGLLSLSR